MDVNASSPGSEHSSTEEQRARRFDTQLELMLTNLEIRATNRHQENNLRQNGSHEKRRSKSTPPTKEGFPLSDLKHPSRSTTVLPNSSSKDNLSISANVSATDNISAFDSDDTIKTFSGSLPNLATNKTKFNGSMKTYEQSNASQLLQAENNRTCQSVAVNNNHSNLSLCNQQKTALCNNINTTNNLDKSKSTTIPNESNRFIPNTMHKIRQTLTTLREKAHDFYRQNSPKQTTNIDGKHQHSIESKEAVSNASLRQEDNDQVAALTRARKSASQNNTQIEDTRLVKTHTLEQKEEDSFVDDELNHTFGSKPRLNIAPSSSSTICDDEELNSATNHNAQADDLSSVSHRESSILRLVPHEFRIVLRPEFWLGILLAMFTVIAVQSAIIWYAFVQIRHKLSDFCVK